MAMDAIYPKKLVPFNSQMNRGVVEPCLNITQYNETPGKLYLYYIFSAKFTDYTYI